MDKPLLDKEYTLQKIPGKGGWTYVEIPEILQKEDTPFRWLKVKGFIDTFEITGYSLMPMGNKKLFLPVKAEIRKKIGKQEGDTVHVILYEDKLPQEVPEELMECLQAEGIYEKFKTLSQSDQKYFINWIYSAKKDETKVERIAKTIDKVLSGKKFMDK